MHTTATKKENSTLSHLWAAEPPKIDRTSVWRGKKRKKNYGFIFIEQSNSAQGYLNSNAVRDPYTEYPTVITPAVRLEYYWWALLFTTRAPLRVGAFSHFETTWESPTRNEHSFLWHSSYVGLVWLEFVIESITLERIAVLTISKSEVCSHGSSSTTYYSHFSSAETFECEILRAANYLSSPSLSPPIHNKHSRPRIAFTRALWNAGDIGVPGFLTPNPLQSANTDAQYLWTRRQKFKPRCGVSVLQ